MTLIRLPDWPERLSEFIEARRERAFSWGENDCALFLADWVLAATGVDPAAKVRGYKTQRGALGRVKRAGGMRELALSCGAIEKHPGLAQRGEGVLAVLDARHTFGVVAGNGMWCGPGEKGLLFRPMSDVITAFEY